MIESVLIAATAVLAALAVLIQAGVLSWIHNNKDEFEKFVPSTIIVVAGFSYLASGLLSNRNLQFASLAVNSVELDASPYISWISRGSNLLLLTIGGGYIFARIADHFWSTQNKIATRNSEEAVFPRLSILLLAVTMMYFVSQALGTEGGFEQKPIYLTVALVSIVLSPRDALLLGLRSAKMILLIYLSTSLIFLGIDHDRVLAPGYRGLIPGFEYRFWGLAPHANAIGPLAALLILLEISVPSKSFLRRLAVITIGAFVMLISQSKTSIGAALVGLALIPFARGGMPLHFSEKRRLSTRHAVLSVLLFAIGLSALVFSTIGMPRALSTLVLKVASAVDIDTMSGRSAIWQVALREFSVNPLFGYGLGIWGPDFRAVVGLNYAYHAHNQLLQSMSESGVCGIVGFMIFFISSYRYCMKSSDWTFGGSVGIFILFVFRCVTEAPLKVSGMGTGETLFLLVLLTFWGIGSTKKRSGVSIG